MSEYKKSETRRLMEDMISGRHPVKDAEGNEYYVRYNENTEELEEIPAPGLRPLTDGQKAEASELAAGLRPQGFGALDIAKEGLKGFGQGVVSGLGRVASGATFGATDWLDRKTGGHLASLDADLQRSAESAGLGGWNKAAKFASELGGNVLGAGGALVKGLGRAGLKGLKLASASGGLEGAVYGATGSDSVDELPENVALGAAFGAALPVGLHGVGRGAGYVVKPFSSRLMTAGMTGGLGNVSGSPEAVKLLKQGIRNNDDVAETYLNRVLPELRGINSAMAGMVDNSLTSRINVPETIATERARYGDYMTRHGADEMMDFAPINKDIKIYRGNDSKSILKSMVRNLEKNDPDFNFRTMKDPETGRIYKDYEHLLSDPERSRYIHTFMDTYNNPQVVKKGSNNGYPRLYKYSIYNNPEHNNKVYDLISQSETGKVLTKIAREGKHGKESLDRIMMPHARQTSDAGRAASQTEMFPPHYSDKNTIPYRSVVVNPELPHISSLYEGLAQGLNRQSLRFGRLSELGNAAERRLRTPEGTRFFGREQLESPGSMIGSAADWANNLLRGRAVRRAALDLMDPNFTGRPLNNGWVVDNPSLAAGLSATAYNNLRNR